MCIYYQDLHLYVYFRIRNSEDDRRKDLFYIDGFNSHLQILLYVIASLEVSKGVGG